MKALQRTLTAVLSALLVVASLCASPVSALDESGACGADMTYTFDASTGTVTLSGTGSMQDYEVGASPFYFSSKVRSLHVGSGVTGVGDNAFRSCHNLTDVTLPTGLARIGRYAFYDCGSLSGASLPTGLTDVGEWAFCGCAAFRNVTFPDSLKTVGYAAFAGCALESVTLPDSLEVLGGYAFSECRLESLSIPALVREIGEAPASCETLLRFSVDEANAYYCTDECGCLFNKDRTALLQYPAAADAATYVIPGTVTRIGEGAFSFSTALCSVVLPMRITEIGEQAFMACSGLTAVRIPNGVTELRYSVFEDCAALESVTLPAGLQRVECSAFAGCIALRDVYFKGSEQQWNNVNVDYDNEPLETAEKHFDYVDPVQKTPGDVDGDGDITLKDAALISRYLVGGWNVTIDADAADVDDDGSVTLKDAALIQRYIVGGWGVTLRSR